MAFLQKEIKHGNFVPRPGVPLRARPMAGHETAMYFELLGSASKKRKAA